MSNKFALGQVFTTFKGKEYSYLEENKKGTHVSFSKVITNEFGERVYSSTELYKSPITIIKEWSKEILKEEGFEMLPDLPRGISPLGSYPEKQKNGFLLTVSTIGTATQYNTSIAWVKVENEKLLNDVETRKQLMFYVNEYLLSDIEQDLIHEGSNYLVSLESYNTSSIKGGSLHFNKLSNKNFPIKSASVSSFSNGMVKHFVNPYSKYVSGYHMEQFGGESLGQKNLNPGDKVTTWENQLGVRVSHEQLHVPVPPSMRTELGKLSYLQTSKTSTKKYYELKNIEHIPPFSKPVLNKQL